MYQTKVNIRVLVQEQVYILFLKRYFVVISGMNFIKTSNVLKRFAASLKEKYRLLYIFIKKISKIVLIY